MLYSDVLEEQPAKDSSPCVFQTMASSVPGLRLVAGLLNVSEARRKDLVEMVAMAAVYKSKGERCEQVLTWVGECKGGFDSTSDWICHS